MICAVHAQKHQKFSVRKFDDRRLWPLPYVFTLNEMGNVGMPENGKCVALIAAADDTALRTRDGTVPDILILRHKRPLFLPGQRAELVRPKQPAFAADHAAHEEQSLKLQRKGPKLPCITIIAADEQEIFAVEELPVMRQSPDVYLFPDDADFCLINGVPVLIQLDGRAPRFSAVRAAKQIDPVFDIRLLLSAALRDDNVITANLHCFSKSIPERLLQHFADRFRRHDIRYIQKGRTRKTPCPAFEFF